MSSFRYIVKDVEMAIAFYRDHLDFELKQQFGPAMAIVTNGDLHFGSQGRKPQRPSKCLTVLFPNQAAGIELFLK